MQVRRIAKKRSRRRIPDSQLQNLVDRLLRNSKPETDTPVIISTVGGEYRSSVGVLQQHEGSRVLALVDKPLERGCEVTVFLPQNAYLAEVTSCVANGKHFAVELILIQYRSNTDD